MRSILDHIGDTPLVPLRLAQHLPVPVLAKCEHLNPAAASRTGSPSPSSAGNTGIGLALVAAARGYGLVCVLPEKMSVDKRRALAAVGAQVLVTPNAAPDDPENFQNVARRLAAERGWFLTDPFRNPANPAAHEARTGPEIAAQVGRIGWFVAGVSTGGTLTGVGRFLRRHHHHGSHDRPPFGRALRIEHSDGSRR